MTMKEAKTAAEKLIPVEYDGVRYERISEVGIFFNWRGQRTDYLTLVKGNTAVRVLPEKVKEAKE